MMERSDAELVASCLEGHRESFAGLVRRHQDSVYRLAYRWTGSGDDARDLSQETFLRAFRKLERYNPNYSFRNWLLQICLNLAHNRHRGEQRRRDACERYGATRSGEAGADASEQAEMDQLLAEIPETMRTPLVLRHVEGLSYDEIAGILDIGVSAAKMRAKRGRDLFMDLIRNV